MSKSKISKILEIKRLKSTINRLINPSIKLEYMKYGMFII